MVFCEFDNSWDCDLSRLEEGPDALEESDENLRMAGSIVISSGAICKE